MKDKFILIGLDDERSKDIAEVLKNQTCKKILDFLADTKEASEQDIATALKMPINTVEYNINKLIKSGLAEKVKNFFWSVKGKRIDMYKLAKKHIIISHKTSKPDLNILRTIIPIIIGLVFVSLIAGFLLYPDNLPSGDTLRNQTQLKQFTSYDELKSFLKENSGSSYNYYGTNNVLQKGMPSATTGMMSEAAPDSQATDYSTTNIQVEGVDEADIVKNDGKYIYTISGNKVIIVDAYPAEKMNILSEINLNKSISRIFINEDRLIIFSQESNYFPAVGCSYEFADRFSGCLQPARYETKSLVYVYDIKDRENPLLENTIKLDGDYKDSRMIGDYVYVISTKYARGDEPILPTYEIGGVETKIQASDIYYFDRPDESYVFTSITSIDIKNSGENVNTKVYLTGYSGGLYVSQNNIYLTYRKTLSNDYFIEGMIEEVFIPLLPEKEIKKVNNIMDSNESYYQKMNRIGDIVQDYVETLTKEEQEQFEKDFEEKSKEFQAKLAKQTEKTIIHKININKDRIQYKNVGEVPGHILNQFSMDEYDRNFRIATTTGEIWERNSLNHLYILDEDLKIVGRVEDLAKGEKIYSARFLGKRAYVVTFKKIDPLFVIDVSNPQNPKVLGYLKITGYSDYLHPYDENHVIGIGKETVEAQDDLKQQRDLDFAWYQGVKVSLFDVSDVQNPIEKAKIVIGDRGTESDALRDHKAVLFDKEKNLLAIPISLAKVDESQYPDGNIPDNAYGRNIWNGLFVLNIDENGISERGRITHDETNEELDRHYGGKYYIKRSLFMDDYLYTISNAKIKANNLNTIHEINTLDLGYSIKEPIYYPVG